MLSRTWSRNAAGRVKSIKNSNDSIANRTRDLPAFSTLPQTIARPRGPTSSVADGIVIHFSLIINWEISEEKNSCGEYLDQVGGGGGSEG